MCTDFIIVQKSYTLIKKRRIYEMSIVGSDIVDQIITVLLSTSMFVGGTMGFILDNTIPGWCKLLFSFIKGQLTV